MRKRKVACAEAPLREDLRLHAEKKMPSSPSHRLAETHLSLN